MILHTRDKHFKETGGFRGITAGSDIGASDIAGISVNGSPCIDEQAVHLWGRFTVLVLVVQQAGVLVLSHNVPIGQLPLIHAAGFKERQMDSEFAGPAGKGRFRRLVAPSALVGCLSHQREFVFGFAGTLEMQRMDDIRGVEDTLIRYGAVAFADLGQLVFAPQLLGYALCETAL